MSAFTASVTARYMRLKQASPSLGGRAASIASIRAIASAIEVTGPDGNGEAAAMATLYGRQVVPILLNGGASGWPVAPESCGPDVARSRRVLGNAPSMGRALANG